MRFIAALFLIFLVWAAAGVLDLLVLGGPPQYASWRQEFGHILLISMTVLAVIEIVNWAFRRD